MNRARNLSGANSYEKELGLSPLEFLVTLLEKQSEVSWLDLCCGTGRALLQAADAVQSTDWECRIKFVGVDVVPMFDAVGPGLNGVRLVSASVERWENDEMCDLITCVHGLHYVGDKLGLLERTSGWMKQNGLLMMHIDYRNLRMAGRGFAGATIGRDLRRAGFRYVSRRHLLVRPGHEEPRPLPYRYLGADDKAGPNYTGQPAVDSYYESVRS